MNEAGWRRVVTKGVLIASTRRDVCRARAASTTGVAARSVRDSVPHPPAQHAVVPVHYATQTAAAFRWTGRLAVVPRQAAQFWRFPFWQSGTIVEGSSVASLPATTQLARTKLRITARVKRPRVGSCSRAGAALQRVHARLPKDSNGLLPRREKCARTDNGRCRFVLTTSPSQPRQRTGWSRCTPPVASPRALAEAVGLLRLSLGTRVPPAGGKRPCSTSVLLIPSIRRHARGRARGAGRNRRRSRQGQGRRAATFR